MGNRNFIWRFIFGRPLHTGERGTGYLTENGLVDYEDREENRFVGTEEEAHVESVRRMSGGGTDRSPRMDRVSLDCVGHCEDPQRVDFEQFRFRVDIGGQESMAHGFAALSPSKKLDAHELPTLEFAPDQMPGTLTFDDITIERGKASSYGDLYDWFKKIKSESNRPVTIIIRQDIRPWYRRWPSRIVSWLRYRMPWSKIRVTDVRIKFAKIEIEGDR